MRSVDAAELQAKCLAILAEVEETGEPVTILKQGRPVARLLPLVPAGEDYPQWSLRGSAETLGDILEPVFPSEAWEALGDRDED